MEIIKLSDGIKVLCSKALFYIENNKINEIKELLSEKDKSLFADFKCFFGCTMLYKAAYSGNIDICNYLINLNVDINEEVRNITALCIAASQGHLNICKCLIEKGAFIDGNISSVITPLSSSIMFGHDEVAKFLIDKGANINAIHLTQNQTPLDYAKIWGRSEIEKILLEMNAISLSKPIDWKNEYGGHLLKYVNDNAGEVLPISFFQIVSNNYNISLRIALVNKKQQKYLFTVGLFAKQKPMIELSIVVSASWNLNDKSPKSMFPCLLLMKLSELILNGMFIDEGDFISHKNTELENLEWPLDIEGFWISNHSWKNEKNSISRVDEDKTEVITIYTLIPEKKAKNKKELKFDKEKMRSLSWSKTALNF